ncbi:hypothetical protein FEM48_Zijuj12G0122300 [Ziziphus jujuba var. spinosa]|uniref:Uncharacterized protein n=1 Tax=Ziziphus jujuba var. spinosa TaxID=714518 RepID=A0A978UD95_ZIZJJ|nr:hypothetical protein FEM48_Zijuj12G0122300 [Ziziphus jujuba var. spinosa]
MTMRFVFSTDKIVPIVVFGFLTLNYFFAGFGSHAQLLPEDEGNKLECKLENGVRDFTIHEIGSVRVFMTFFHLAG